MPRSFGELGNLVIGVPDAVAALRPVGPSPGFGPARLHDDIAWLAYSSGTTARPKGAVHTEETLALIADGFRERYGIGRDDVVLVAAPVGHAVGFIYGVELALRARCSMVLMPSWDAVACAELIAHHGCTFVAAPTPFLLDLVDLAERRGPRAWRACESSSAAAHPFLPRCSSGLERAFPRPTSLRTTARPNAAVSRRARLTRRSRRS